MVWILVACSEVSVDSGTAGPDDLCAWAGLAWRDTFANVCDAESERTGVEGCYDELVVTIEPIAMDVESSVVDFAACLKADELRVYEGSVQLWSGSLNQAEGTLPGFLSADDGLDPCFGMTAGLMGDYASGAYFTDGSFWWDNGDDADAVGDPLTGALAEDGATIAVSTPAIEYLGIKVELGLEETITVVQGTKDHWDTPECSSEKEGGA